MGKTLFQNGLTLFTSRANLLEGPVGFMRARQDGKNIHEPSPLMGAPSGETHLVRLLLHLIGPSAPPLPGWMLPYSSRVSSPSLNGTGPKKVALAKTYQRQSHVLASRQPPPTQFPQALGWNAGLLVLSQGTSLSAAPR